MFATDLLEVLQLELILEKGLEHQQKAVEAIGQVFRNVGFSFDPQNRKNPVFSLGSQDLLYMISLIRPAW